MGNPVKLSLNLPALERLLGGDTQLEIELRQQVVNNFTKHHLTEMIKDKAFKAVVEEIRLQAETVIAEQIGKTHKQGVFTIRHELTDKVQTLIREYIESIVRTQLDYVSRQMVAKIEEWKTNWERYIESRVQTYLNDTIRQKIDQGVKEKLAKIAEQVSK